MNRLLAGLLALFLAAPAVAVAQPNLSNMPANTVFGRLGLGSGPGQAIPFANLTARLLSSNPQLVLSPALHDGAAGLSDIGIFLTPTVGSPTTNGSFLTPYNLQWGTSGTPIAAGTLGSLDGYECNQTTNQTNSDTSTALGNHCFGATIVLHGGTQAQGFAITATIDTVAPTGYIGGDLNITKNIAGGSAKGYFVGSTGSQPADVAYEANGLFTSTFKSTSFNIDSVGNVVLGFTGQSTNPSLQFLGKTSQAVTLVPQDSAGNAQLTLPKATGTLVSRAVVPMVINAVTGDISIGTNGVPTIASGACGATTNGTIAGTNLSGVITIGAAATTTCTVSFSATLANAPGACLIFPGNAAAAATGTTVARVGTPSTSAWVITGSALASTVYSYICL